MGVGKESHVHEEGEARVERNSHVVPSDVAPVDVEGCLDLLEVTLVQLLLEGLTRDLHEDRCLRLCLLTFASNHHECFK